MVLQPVDDPTNGSQLPQDLRFERKGMVRWLDPVQLIQTGIRTTISTVFGEYADKREMQAALAKDVDDPFTDYVRDDIWIDFVADTGDGFRSTYTVAYVLAQEELVLDSEPKLRLPRGEILVMGGDQVYPTPSRTGYEDRLIGPYEAALPEADPRPDLYAIPGNHDWYDGLTNFLRFFCADHPIGGWQTRQRRSYFALRLTKTWWLWGLDIQFDAYIDEPQLEYFDRAGKELNANDRVLLATGKPSWTHAPKKESSSYENLRYVEERIIETGGRRRDPDPNDPPPAPRPTAPVMLTGDDHHYARYESADGRQKLTAGGGGAFLSATHHLRDSVLLRRGFNSPGEGVQYDLKMRYPDSAQSRRIGWHVLYRLWTCNHRFLYAVFIAYLVPALMLQVPATKIAAEEDATLWEFWRATVASEWFLYMLPFLFVPLFLYAAVERAVLRALAGFLHLLPHAALLVSLVAVTAFELHESARSRDEGDFWRENFLEADLTVALIAAFLAALPGAIIVGAYLVVMDGSSRKGQAFERHVTELFAAQQLTSHKNFLRIHIDGGSGVLTIYPIGIDEAGEFEVRADRTAADPYFKPKEPIQWHLIEEPVVVGGAPVGIGAAHGVDVA